MAETDIYKIKLGSDTYNLPFLPLSGGTMSGNITLGGGNAIIGSGNSIPAKFKDSASINPEVHSIWLAAIGTGSNNTAGSEASGILFDGNTIKMWSPLDNSPLIIDSDNGAEHTLLHSGNITKDHVGLGNVDNTADANKSVNYAATAGGVAWDNVSGKPTVAIQQTSNDFVHNSNEWTVVPSGYSGALWLNYRTTGGTNGNITDYNFGNGKGGCLATISNGQFSGNAATATYADSAGIANSVAWSNVSSRPGNFTGASSDAAGSAGFVPAPSKGAQGYFLRGDATWQPTYNLQYLGGASYITINVGGDANTYYPVVISSVSSKYPMQLINISRAYSETAPDSWNTSTHKGGLTMTLFWNGSRYWDGNGSGSPCYVIYLYQSYCTMVANHGNSVIGKVIWLRGGGATYHIHSMNGAHASATVYLEGFTDSANNQFLPTTEVTNFSVGYPYAISAGSAPASDVYDWAKAASKPSYSHDEITAGNLTIGDGANSLSFRTNASWASSIYHHTSSDEAVVFLNKGKNVSGTKNYTTSWIFAYGTPSERPAWTGLTPAMQIKGESVVINKLLGSQVGASYNLDVNGSANATTLYENGTRVSLSGHNHDDRYYTETEIDTKLSGKANSTHGTHVTTSAQTWSGVKTFSSAPVFSVGFSSGGNATITGKVSASSGFYEESDERLKSFKDPLKVDLEKLSKLRKSYFTFNSDPDNLQIGVSAQEIQSLYPEIVSENENGNLTVAYDKLSVIVLSAVDILHEENTKLKQQNEEILKRLEKIEKLLSI